MSYLLIEWFGMVAITTILVMTSPEFKEKFKDKRFSYMSIVTITLLTINLILWPIIFWAFTEPVNL